MINFVKGKLVEIFDNKIIVETGGVGFDIFFPSSNIVNLPELDTEIKIYTFMNVKEDEISLYGFLTKEDKEMFLKLLTVNSVGPKGALNIISKLGFSTLIKAIANEDASLISSVPGIGQKTASKICIELGDKIRKLNFDSKLDIIKANNDGNKKIQNVREEAIEALIKLGYKENKAREILSSLDLTGDETSSDILKLALKK